MEVWRLSTKDGSATYAMNRDDLPFGGFLVQGYDTEICECIEVDAGSNCHRAAVKNTLVKNN
jgi:hypothetical protein